ncbi:MAG: shikimate dehydrogenase [Chloroflexi bacterium]|nr:shikimate dehydrogenase [Chloroflexota bacterium]
MTEAEREVTQATKPVGLIGYPVEHSLSPAMHNAAFAKCALDYRYLLLPAAPEEFPAVVQSCIAHGFVGWNVTVPHKERMISFLDEASNEVVATGACNTVRVEAGRLLGFNTDIAGFMQGLEEAGGIPDGSKTVVLGAGGAARSVVKALTSGGHEVHILSRMVAQATSIGRGLNVTQHAQIAYGTLDRAALASALPDAALLVNCTPAGMWPHVEQSPLPDGILLPQRLLVYDLVYRPRPTRLLQQAVASGCRTQDGLAMLVHQGAAAFRLWTGGEAPLDTMREACCSALAAGRR